MAINIAEQIEALVQFAERNDLITKWDRDDSRNRLMNVLGLDSIEPVKIETVPVDSPVAILESILDWAADHGRLPENTVTYRDLLDTKLMGCVTGRPSEIIRQFQDHYDQAGPEAATQAFYQFSKHVHYIRTDRIAKNEHWYTPTEYGDLEMTINLSKPEKDPKAIAAAKNLQASSYPQCLLCKENVGYAGRVNHPARQNLRIIPLELAEEQWYMQFSPYVYYNEHAIVFLGEHHPMKISKKTFARLLQFVEQLPHYFLGSNADLPIVGGSILSHDHFQGGKHEFPMAKAETEERFKLEMFPGVEAGIIKWPMSVIRLNGSNQTELVEAGHHIFETWKHYSDERVEIHAYSGETPHNTVTPIARRRKGQYELDLVLRNNRTNEKHPDGLFHPHQEVHHIKKENIGLIEVMGLAVLPGRLKDELKALGEALVQGNARTVIVQNEEIQKHEKWAMSVKEAHPELNQSNVESILKDEVGNVFSTILEHAGVFKRDEEGMSAFKRFVKTLNK